MFADLQEKGYSTLTELCDAMKSVLMLTNSLLRFSNLSLSFLHSSFSVPHLTVFCLALHLDPIDKPAKNGALLCELQRTVALRLQHKLRILTKTK